MYCHLIKERGEKGNGWRGVLFTMGEVIEAEDVNKDKPALYLDNI
jgi:hypothetical protein